MKNKMNKFFTRLDWCEIENKVTIHVVEGILYDTLSDMHGDGYDQTIGCATCDPEAAHALAKMNPKKGNPE